MCACETKRNIEKKYFKISILYSEKIEIRIMREREGERGKRERKTEKDRERVNPCNAPEGRCLP